MLRPKSSKKRDELASDSSPAFAGARLSGPASGVAGVWVAIWQAEANDAKRRARSDCQFVKRRRSRKARRNSRRDPRHGRAGVHLAAVLAAHDHALETSSSPVPRDDRRQVRMDSGLHAADIAGVARLLYSQAMRSATFPPIRVKPEVRAEVEAVLREGESLTQFIEEAVVAAAAWRRVQSEFVTRGEAAIERWKQEGGGRAVDEVMADLQARLDEAKHRAAPRVRR